MRGGRGGRVFESRLIIGEDVRAARSQAVYERRDPVTDAVVTRAAAGGTEDAQDAADAAAAGFAGWSATAPCDRADILRRAAGILRDRVEEAVAIAREETGAAPDWTRFNAQIAEGMLRQAAELALSPALDAVVVPGPETGLTYRVGRRPAGVVLAIAPWNASVTLATRAVAAPLACGNTVVLKGSELCPKTHEWVAGCIRAAGLPEGALNFLTNAPEHAAEVVEALIAHRAVRRVNFTGSTRVGREIAVMAARHLKPCLLELSGKGTLVVLEDADLDAAAAAAAHGAFVNQGQVCMSTERIVVVDAVADAFVARLADRARALRAPEGGDSPLGRLVGPGAVMRLIGLIEDAVTRGAVLVTGGEHFGAVLQPTVLDHVHAGMRVHSDEAFGPVAAVVRVADEEEALSVANDTAFGLVASVFCREAARGLAFVAQVDCGIGHVNGSTVYDDPAMPFGGVKASGYGRFGGQDAIHEFTERHWITLRGGSGTDAGAERPATQREERP
jgi:acyl-CoA reductase-like NAD-dependent aldehyde dehydrogenase